MSQILKHSSRTSTYALERKRKKTATQHANKNIGFWEERKIDVFMGGGVIFREVFSKRVRDINHNNIGDVPGGTPSPNR